jgi:hypothetical protein
MWAPGNDTKIENLHAGSPAIPSGGKVPPGGIDAPIEYGGGIDGVVQRALVDRVGKDGERGGAGGGDQGEMST